jgi:hypothetical protein
MPVSENEFGPGLEDSPGDTMFPAGAEAGAETPPVELRRAMTTTGVTVGEGMGQRYARLASGGGHWEEMFWWTISLVGSLGWLLLRGVYALLTIGAFFLSLASGNPVTLLTATFTMLALILQTFPVMIMLPVTVVAYVVMFVGRRTAQIVFGYLRLVWYLLLRPILYLVALPILAVLLGGGVLLPSCVIEVRGRWRLSCGRSPGVWRTG